MDDEAGGGCGCEGVAATALFVDWVLLMSCVAFCVTVNCLMVAISNSLLSASFKRLNNVLTSNDSATSRNSPTDTPDETALTAALLEEAAVEEIPGFVANDCVPDCLS